MITFESKLIYYLFNLQILCHEFLYYSIISIKYLILNNHMF